MPRTKAQAQIEKDLVKEVRTLAKEVRRLHKLEFVKILKRPWKLIGLSFVKGMAAGLGSVVGATVVVGLLIYLLAQVSVVPFLGDFIQDVLQQINIPQEISSP